MKLILSFAALLLNLCAVSQTPTQQAQSSNDTSKVKMDKYCEQFMQTFSKGLYSKAIQSLKEASYMDEAKIDKLDTALNIQMQQVRYAYGSTIGYEFVEEKKINNTVARRRYLLKFKQYFAVFDFTLYHNDTGWTVVNFDFNSNNKMLF